MHKHLLDITPNESGASWLSLEGRLLRLGICYCGPIQLEQATSFPWRPFPILFDQFKHDYDYYLYVT